MKAAISIFLAWLLWFAIMLFAPPPGWVFDLIVLLAMVGMVTVFVLAARANATGLSTRSKESPAERKSFKAIAYSAFGILQIVTLIALIVFIFRFLRIWLSPWDSFLRLMWS